jgi:hypothetical protein
VPIVHVPPSPHNVAGNRRPCSFVRHDAGRITHSTLIFFVLIAAVVYLALLYLPPWMAYRAMLEVIQEQVGAAAVSSDDEISDRIMATAKAWDVPITKEQIEITRTDGRMSISTEWDVTVNVLGGKHQHVLHFAPSTDSPVVPAAR